MLLSSLMTRVARNVCLLYAHTLEDAFTPLVSCIVNDALVHEVPNVQQTLL